jgi:alpha-N-arabinofuranosidase
MKMATRTSILKMPAVLLAILFLTFVSAAQTPPVNVAIDASKTGAPISKNIYGQFLEHGGDIVNTGLWSELLTDRKFYYPVSATAPQATSAEGRRGGQSPLPPADRALVGADWRR